MWSFFNKKGLLAPDTIVPYVKCHQNHENVSFLFEIIKVQHLNTIFDKVAPFWNNIV